MGCNIQVFQNPEFGKIRTTKINGNPWFVAKRDFSESEMLLHAGKLLREICMERKLPTSILSKLIGKKLSTLDYSIQFVKNESLIN